MNAAVSADSQIEIVDGEKTRVGIVGQKALSGRRIAEMDDFERRQDTVYLRGQLLTAIRDGLQGVRDREARFAAAEEVLFGRLDEEGRFDPAVAARPLTVREIREAMNNLTDFDSVGLFKGVRAFCRQGQDSLCLPNGVENFGIDRERLLHAFEKVAMAYTGTVLRSKGVEEVDIGSLLGQTRAYIEEAISYCGEDRDLQAVVVGNLQYLFVDGMSEFRGMDVVQKKIRQYKADLDAGRTLKGGRYFGAVRAALVEGRPPFDPSVMLDLDACIGEFFRGGMLKPKASTRTVHCGLLKFVKAMCDHDSRLSKGFRRQASGEGGDANYEDSFLAHLMIAATLSSEQRHRLAENLRARTGMLRAVYSLRLEGAALPMGKAGVLIGLKALPHQIMTALRVIDGTVPEDLAEEEVEREEDNLKEEVRRAGMNLDPASVGLRERDLVELGF